MTIRSGLAEETTPHGHPGTPFRARPAQAGPRARVPALPDVTIDDDFWAPRREVVRTLTIPQQERELHEGGYFDLVRGDWQPGQAEPQIFWESDIAKWIEAASYSLAQFPDPALDDAVDAAIALLAGGQQPDGYLNGYFTHVRPGERFTDLRDAHELYCLGHLIEAAVAHTAATGKTTLLDVVRRYVDLVEREFGPGGPLEGGYDGHEEVELALVKLARATGERRYVELAQRFVDARGQQPFYYEAELERRGNEGYFAQWFATRPEQPERFREYNQTHLPVREQADAVGHAVRAVYLYSAMADLAAETGDASLRAACERLWESVTRRKMYVTGGIGSVPAIEGFGPDYSLPNDTNYCETCAAIGLIMWAQRMAALTGEARYAEVMERALYNAVLSGASSDGTHYFYDNPMSSDGEHQRQAWFGCACCPPNYARLLMSLQQYAYVLRDGGVDVNLIVGGTANLDVSGTGEGAVRLDVATGYPWDGSVAIDVTPQRPTDVVLRIRVPAWADGVRVTLNGVEADDVVVDGYITLQRTWQAGDSVRIELPMPVRRVWADPRVRADVGRVALARGPFVYCVEQAGGTVDPGRVVLPRDSEPATRWSPDLAAVVAEVPVRELQSGADLYEHAAPRSLAAVVEAVPYYAWGNRGPGVMRVWLLDELV